MVDNENPAKRKIPKATPKARRFENRIVYNDGNLILSTTQLRFLRQKKYLLEDRHIGITVSEVKKSSNLRKF